MQHLPLVFQLMEYLIWTTGCSVGTGSVLAFLVLINTIAGKGMYSRNLIIMTDG